MLTVSLSIMTHLRHSAPHSASGESRRLLPNPDAARLFQSFCLSPEAQQLIIHAGGLRSMHPSTKDKAGRKPFRDIKTMKDDAAAVEREGDAIKAHYRRIFKV